MIIVIHAANIHDSVGARVLMRSLKDKYLTGIVKIFADGGYMGDLIDWVRIQFQWTLEIVKRTEEHTFLKSCPKDGLLNELLPGSRFIEDCPKTMKDCPNLVRHLSSYQ